MRELDPLADLPGGLGRALAEPSFELVDVGSDEDRAGSGDLVLDEERTIRLELQHRHSAVSVDSVELGAKRPVALVRDVRDPFEERSFRDPGGELLVGEEPVLASVLLTGTLRARGGGDRDLELRQTVVERPDQRSLARAGGTSDDEYGPHGVAPAGAA